MALVKETRILFDIRDIRNLRVACGTCGFEMMFAPHQNREIPKKCPYCPSEWVDALNANNPAWDKVVSLIQAVAYLSKLQNPPVSLRFEIDDDAKGKASNSEETK